MLNKHSKNGQRPLKWSQRTKFLPYLVSLHLPFLFNHFFHFSLRLIYLLVAMCWQLNTKWWRRAFSYFKRSPSKFSPMALYAWKLGKKNKVIKTSVTRFGEILPLWHDVKNFGHFERVQLALGKNFVLTTYVIF